MSNFSAIQAVPFCILDLDELGYSIYDLDRCGVQQWIRGIQAYYAGYDCYPYDSFTEDDFVGSQWPIGLTYQQLVWFYWKPKSIAWDGYYSICDFSGCESPEANKYTQQPYTAFENSFRRINPLGDWPTNCDKDYGTRNDLWPATHIVNYQFFTGSTCGGGSPLSYYTGTWNPATCFYINYNTIVRAFFPALGLLSDEEFGIPALSAHTAGQMPRIIKKNSLYWPTFSFDFNNECEPFGSGGSDGGTTFDLPYHGHKDTTCTYGVSPGTEPPYPDCPENTVNPCGCLMSPSSTGFAGNLVIDGDSVEVPLHASGKVDSLDIPCPPAGTGCYMQGLIDCGSSCITITDREFYNMTFVE